MSTLKYVHILLNLFVITSNLIKINVNNSSDDGKIVMPFWKSTGFSPPLADVTNYLLSEDIKRNLIYISAVPNSGIEYIRVHWLFNLIICNKEETDCNFKELFQFLDHVNNTNLKLNFELMGKLKNSMKPNWAYLVHQITYLSIKKYGLTKISKWRFEFWNEPDLKMYNIMNFTLNSYLNYISECMDGFKRTQELLNIKTMNWKIGGPAGLFKNPKTHKLCWGLLEYCNSNLNNCPLTYISFHKKGNSSSRAVIMQDIQLTNQIHSKFPSLTQLPIANDEADILVNWSKSQNWRGDVRYAAMIANVVIDHYLELVVKRNVSIEILSNDNGFLNYFPFYFTQRTLLARFQINNTTPPHTQFIRKPCYTIMGLLSLLETQHIPIPHFSNRYIKVLMTKSTYKSQDSPICRAQSILTMLVTYANNTKTSDGRRTMFSMQIGAGLNMHNAKYVIYILDNARTNPFQIWRDNASPVFPDGRQREQMRNAQEPYRLKEPTGLNTSTVLNLEIELRMPSIMLLHLCEYSENHKPGPVTDLQVLNVTFNEVIIFWKDTKINTRCIKTYEIEFQQMSEDNRKSSGFKRINNEDIIFLIYQFDAGLKMKQENGSYNVETSLDQARGFYRARAVDYWNKFGEYSTIYKYM